MSDVQIRIPRSLEAYLSSLAEREGVSVEQFVASAIAEKASALMTESYLSERAARGTRSRYDAALAAVPDTEPETGDRP